jgi:two-component system, LytTR family, sensor kinase
LPRQQAEKDLPFGTMDKFWRYKIDHIIFWTATVFFHMFTRLSLISKVDIGQFLLEIAVRNSLLAIVIYVNLLVLIPRYAQQRRWLGYLILLAIDLALYVVCKNAHDVYLYGHVMGDVSRRDFSYNTFYNLSIAVFYMAFSVALQLSREWYGQRELIRKIEVEKLNTELDYLKAQINPHFLFNSINTIYFQIDKQNTIARDTLSAFSEMLRYQLYECNGKEIPIEKEVNYLKNYVELQRHRKDDNYRITFAANDSQGFTIAPLLLIPFIENAFKYVSHFSTGNEIRIDLRREDGYFSLNVFNTKDKSSMNPTEAHGIGLKNVKRRLELLYPNRHTLQVTNLPDSFEVSLKIKLNGYETELSDR